MGDQKGQPYFLVEGRGLIRLIALVIAVWSAYTVIDAASRAWNRGLRYTFSGDHWQDIAGVLVMLILMIVFGSVALKGKFSIP